MHKIAVVMENTATTFVSDQLRKEGKAVELIPYDTAHAKADYEAYAKRTGITQITYKIGE